MNDFNDMERIWKKREDQFYKLLIDQCAIIPNVGDTVIIAAGLLGLGFDWVRLEAVVLKVGQNSFKIQFQTEKEFRTSKLKEEWIHPALITDVIKQESGVDDEI